MVVVQSKIAHEIWDRKYRLKRADGAVVDAGVADTFARVATALAKAEKPAERGKWQKAFLDIMSDMSFLPAGRILAGAGSGRSVTLFNCFVMGRTKDSISGIFDELKHAALAMQQGGGIGQDFSTIRPAGAPVEGVGADASGPVSFMHVWDAMCATIMSAGARRGAMMATLSCDHPDIFDFINAKRSPGKLRMFNLSVLVSDALMAAVKTNADWPLQFDGKVYKTVRARELWDAIMAANYDSAEPGVIFIDRINAQNNLSYCETIYATNPCGEQPLPPFGACLLGSVNLVKFVCDPFTDKARLDEKRLAKTVETAVRLLDNVIDVSKFPLPQLAHEAKSKRRIGLGVTGLANALAMCRLDYGDAAAVTQAGHWMALIEKHAYRASALLAAQKGCFERYERDSYLQSPGVLRLDEETQTLVAKYGMRNGLVTSIAPTGTISLFAGNVSSGIEPVFAHEYKRRILRADASHDSETVCDYAVRLYRDKFGAGAALPDYFVTARQLSPAQHLAMQAALQQHVDSAISKTINCDRDISQADFTAIYEQAYELGLKGCTTYRPNAITGAVLSETAETAPAAATGVSDTAGDAGGDIVYMKQPLEREATLPGFTYKLKWPDSAHAIYITINDIVQNGRRRPFEVFINSKNMEHYAWTVALTRMISAVFRRGGDVTFVVEELKAVFDPRGGQWMQGKYVPSLLAAIGGIIEQHMIEIGFLSAKGASVPDETVRKLAVAGQNESAPGNAAACPQCGEAALVFQEGCLSCLACGHSKCS